MYRANHNGMSLHRRPRVEEFEKRLCLAGVAFAKHDIVPDGPGAESVIAADLDGDGDEDIISSEWRLKRTVWYENIDGKARFGQQKLIATDVSRALYPADVDGDGDLDVLLATGEKIDWYENTDGKGNFGQQPFITRRVAGAAAVYAADIDNDGDLDVVSASHNDGKIAWYENTDGKGSFGQQLVITNAADGASSVSAADLDGDGDQDVVSASHHDDKIAWYENIDGDGTFGPQKVLSVERETGWVASVLAYPTDVDGDGDIDVLAQPYLGPMGWYENTDGRGNFGSLNAISSNPSTDLFTANPGNDLFAADVDGDGDTDVLSALWWSKEIALYENMDGKGTFGTQQVIATTAEGTYRSVMAADLDGDGDLDVLPTFAKQDGLVWHENLGRPGDANHDGLFNQLDIVQVLQANKYLSGEPAPFEQGDWNQDGVFDQLDIVEALATGRYLQ